MNGKDELKNVYENMNEDGEINNDNTLEIEEMMAIDDLCEDDFKEDEDDDFVVQIDLASTDIKNHILTQTELFKHKTYK